VSLHLPLISHPHYSRALTERTTRKLMAQRAELPLSWSIGGENLVGTLSLDRTAFSQLHYAQRSGLRVVSLPCVFRVRVSGSTEGKAKETNATDFSTGTSVPVCTSPECQRVWRHSGR
jgi:hypothetical protein